MFCKVAHLFLSISLSVVISRHSSPWFLKKPPSKNRSTIMDWIDRWIEKHVIFFSIHILDFLETLLKIFIFFDPLSSFFFYKPSPSPHTSAKTCKETPPRISFWEIHPQKTYFELNKTLETEQKKGEEMNEREGSLRTLRFDEFFLRVKQKENPTGFSLQTPLLLYTFLPSILPTSSNPTSTLSSQSPTGSPSNPPYFYVLFSHPFTELVPIPHPRSSRAPTPLWNPTLLFFKSRLSIQSTNGTD